VMTKASGCVCYFGRPLCVRIWPPRVLCVTLVLPGDNEVNNVLNGSLNGEGMRYTASAAPKWKGSVALLSDCW
jgi:hypothetical protein